MKVPPKRKGNQVGIRGGVQDYASLNESPSEKEGKCRLRRRFPRRVSPLNESPSEKEGKYRIANLFPRVPEPLNESPSEKEGKSPEPLGTACLKIEPSMKVPPKRKGNLFPGNIQFSGWTLNESPSEKEGKFGAPSRGRLQTPIPQ